MEGHAPFKLVRERLLVEEDPGVAEARVEAALELGHARERAVQLGVADEHQEDGAGAPGRVRAALIVGFRKGELGGVGARRPWEMRADGGDGREVGVVWAEMAQEGVEAELRTTSAQS